MYDWFGRWYHRLFIPSNTPEMKDYTNDLLREHCQAFPDELQEIFEPPMMGVPTPPTAWAFGYELVHGTDESRISKLRRLLLVEYCALFVLCWANEISYGGRRYVIPQRTVEILQQNLESVPNFVPNMGTDQVFQLMLDTISLYPQLRCTDRIQDNRVEADLRFPEAQFLVTIRPSPDIDTTSPIAGTVHKHRFADRRRRPGNRMLRGLQRRSGSSLAAILNNNEIHSIPGLQAFVMEHWPDASGRPAIHEILERFLAELSKMEATNSRLRFDLEEARIQGYHAPSTGLRSFPNDTFSRSFSRNDQEFRSEQSRQRSPRTSDTSLLISSQSRRHSPRAETFQTNRFPRRLYERSFSTFRPKRGRGRGLSNRSTASAYPRAASPFRMNPNDQNIFNRETDELRDNRSEVHRDVLRQENEFSSYPKHRSYTDYHPSFSSYRNEYGRNRR